MPLRRPVSLLVAKVAKIGIFYRWWWGAGPVQRSKIPLYGELLPKVKIVRAEITPFRDMIANTRAIRDPFHPPIGLPMTLT